MTKERNRAVSVAQGERRSDFDAAEVMRATLDRFDEFGVEVHFRNLEFVGRRGQSDGSVDPRQEPTGPTFAFR